MPLECVLYSGKQIGPFGCKAAFWNSNFFFFMLTRLNKEK